MSSQIKSTSAETAKAILGGKKEAIVEIEEPEVHSRLDRIQQALRVLFSMSREQESFLQAFSNDLNGLCNKFQGRWKLSAMFGTHGPAIKQSASSESMRSLLQQLAPLTETHAVEVVTQLLQQVSEDAWASVVSYLFRNLAEVPRENLPDLWHLLLEQCSTDTTPITAPSVAFAGSIGPHLVGVARQDENTMPAMLLTVGRMRMARMLRKPKWPISVRGMWQPLSHRDSLTISVSPSAGRPTTQCWLQRQFSRNAAASSNNTVFLLLKGDALLGSSSTPVPDFAEDGDDGTNIFDFIFTVNVSGSAMVRIRRHKPSADDAISPENDWVVATLEAGAGDEEATDANPTGPAVVKVFNRENLQGGIEMSVSKITVFVEESMPSGQEKSAERDGHRPIPDASTASDGEPLHGAACNLDEEATAPLLQGPTISWPGAQQWTILGHVEECYDTD